MLTRNAERLVELFVVGSTLALLALTDGSPDFQPNDTAGPIDVVFERREVASDAGSSPGPVSESLAAMARTVGLLHVHPAASPDDSSRRTRC